MNKVKALFINTSSAGVSYWRMFSFWPAAIRTGVMDIQMPFWQKDLTEPHPWQLELDDPFLKRAYMDKLWECLREVDVVVCQMVHFEKSLRLFSAIWDLYDVPPVGKVPVVVECDDNYRNTPAYNPAANAYEAGTLFRRIATTQFRLADAIVVSTPGLKQLYGDYNDHVYVIPNSIDFPTWDRAVAKHKTKPGIRIGWAGGANHERDLKIMEPVIKRIMAKYRDVKFVFVHGAPKFLREIPGVEYVPKFTPILKYPQFLADQDFDIGIAPLELNTFNEGKSNLRWLEYSALGIPTVASSVGHFQETIRNGKDGILVENSTPAIEEDQWVEHLSKLIEDRGYRVRMGIDARDRVRRDFNVDFTVGTYADALRDIIGRGRVPKNDKEIFQRELAGVPAGGVI